MKSEEVEKQADKWLRSKFKRDDIFEHENWEVAVEYLRNQIIELIDEQADEIREEIKEDPEQWDLE